MEDIAKSIRFCEGLSTKKWSGKLDLSYQPEMLNIRLSTRIWKKDRSIGQLHYFWESFCFSFEKRACFSFMYKTHPFPTITNIFYTIVIG